MFAITFKMMTRRAVACIMLVLLAVGGTLGMLIMGGLTDSQYAALEKAYDETEIKVVLSNARGNTTVGIALPKLIYDKLSQEPLSEYIERVALRCTSIYNTYVEREIEPEEENMGAEQEAGDDNVQKQEDHVEPQMEKSSVRAVGITYSESVHELSKLSGIHITYFEGYDEGLFLTDSNLCVIPQSLQKYTVTDDDGSTKIVLIYEETRWVLNRETMTYEEVTQRIQKRFTVAGTFNSYTGTNVYCPFKSVAGWVGNRDSEICEFYISDNRKIEDLRCLLSEHFVEPDLRAEDQSGVFAYKIQDDIFKETIESTNRNIALLEILIPVLYAVGGGIGFLVCFMFIRTRTREFAIMRSLGMKQLSVVLLTFGEQAIPAAIGATAAYAVYAFLIKGNDLINGLIFIACYLLGVLVSTIWITGVNVMKTLKAED